MKGLRSFWELSRSLCIVISIEKSVQWGSASTAPPSKFASERDDAALTAASPGGVERGSINGMVCDIYVHFEKIVPFHSLHIYIFKSYCLKPISDIFHVIDQPVMLKDLIPVPSRFGWVVLPLSCRIWQGFGQPGFHPICPYIFEIKVTSCSE